MSIPRVIYEHRTIYIPIYVTVPGVSVSRRSKIAQRLGSLIAGCQDPEKKKKLEELKNIINGILSKLRSVPGSGMKNAILGMLEACLDMAEGGDIGGALNFAVTIQSITNKAIKIGENLMALLNTAKSMAASLGGAAGAAMAKVVAKAEEGLATASDPSQLEDICNMLEHAVNLGKKLESVPKGSAAYNDYLAELEQLGGAGQSPQPQMGGDMLALGFGEGRDMLKGLIDKATDPFQIAKLSQLQVKLHEIQQAAGELPAGLQAGVLQRMHQVVTDAANGDLDGALAGAGELSAFANQAKAMLRVLEAKEDRLAGLASQGGPGAERLSALLDAAKAAKAGAGSLDDLKGIDQMLMDAIDLASKMASLPSGDLRLRALDRQLGELQKRLAGMAPEGPGFGDALNLSAGQGAPPSPGAPGSSGEVDFAAIAGMIDAVGSPGGNEPSPKEEEDLERLSQLMGMIPESN